MNGLGFYPAEALLPANADLTKWSVVACDQYTSQPDYWQEVEQFVGEAPSTLRMIVPELYLEEDGVEKRIADVNAAMDRYLASDLFRVTDQFLYVERTLRDGKLRRGLMGVVDLEQYDFTKGSESLIRATEGTVLERIPPRVKVREDASLECPHIMLLIDDPAKTVIEPIADRMGDLEEVYRFDLMQDSGSIAGYQCDDAESMRILGALGELADPESFNRHYGLNGKSPLLFAVGDGNHSLATAKTCYENLKKTLPEEEYRAHPARYALVEVVNLHDASLEFEPIHRIVFDVDEEMFLAALESQCGSADGQRILVCNNGQKKELRFNAAVSNLPVGTLQSFLDAYIAENGGRVDYIHGNEVVEALSSKPGNIGFLLEAMPKEELFKTVVLDGALPRKTFSMGHAWDKRFYLECRKIKAE
ncbi:DUF1015 domain-containing protein [Anaeromassilibacillus senegalensis]|uniref:DUF1015 domain-containing protein n=1 Tax=Anaeromassilibacillus senegalensis TaxID=1673717 RepID=UPI0006835EF3|nr:DUF1015 domain-containing protein [Anaeromassilibacillus senegalensis]